VSTEGGCDGTHNMHRKTNKFCIMVGKPQGKADLGDQSTDGCTVLK
jgi:hypothetical protein